ncbi:DUF6502 family protein [Litoribacillus peritrichatus]|uniref:DUF6502 family protein n=2 Tax=Litoribacillus peritrichatus TaxID=718191 RepID=A0ABP7N516_9GAMM
MIGIMPANTPTPPNAAEPPKAVIKALKKVLTPLVRLLLSFQITLPYLIELLKSTYVDVADRDFKLDNKKQTDARISLLTGVHRKDTRRLRNQTDNEEEHSAAGIGSQLVANWISKPEYLDESGEPRRLAFKAKANEPDEADFEHLVQSVCKQDMRARVILDEWLRLGMASLIDDHWVELNKKAFLPDSSLDEKAFFLGMNVADHLEAASTNLRSEQPPFLERCVYYDGLSEASIQELKVMAENQGMELLQALNKKAIELKEKDQLKNTSSTLRMNTGLYFFSEPSDSDNESA